jgi:hypothetical protein
MMARSLLPVSGTARDPGLEAAAVVDDLLVDVVMARAARQGELDLGARLQELEARSVESHRRVRERLGGGRAGFERQDHRGRGDRNCRERK